MPIIFNNFDLTGFWSDENYSREKYVEKPVTDVGISTVEKALGYKLPAAYIELMRTQNGGMVQKTCFPLCEPAGSSDEYIKITGIFGIGSMKAYSLCGSLGSKFMIDMWGYPDIGICLCNTPSTGHDFVMLDYSDCGPTGEPRVIHVDQEMHYQQTLLAPTFEAFIRGLTWAHVFDTSAADLEDALKRIELGTFSSALTRFFASESGRGLEKPFRALLASLTRSKGYFALHADPESLVAYDFQFYVQQKSNGPIKRDAYLNYYPCMIAFGEGAITTRGYGPGFIEDWLAMRLRDGLIELDSSHALRGTDKLEHNLLTTLHSYRPT